MMTNLFSSFDPTTSSNLSLNWVSSWLFILIIPTSFWLFQSRPNIILNTITKKLNNEFNTIMNNNNNNKGSALIFISTFMLIMMSNIMGLLPYVFTSTSHMAMSLSLALPLWLSLNLFGWLNKPNHMLEHLVPFMVCIESISTLIRPETLAIRLSANMIAGHLLISLLGNTGTKINEILLMSMLMIQTALFMLESAVVIIQAYVFSVLTTLYSSEIN